MLSSRRSVLFGVVFGLALVVVDACSTHASHDISDPDPGSAGATGGDGDVTGSAGESASAGESPMQGTGGDDGIGGSSMGSSGEGSAAAGAESSGSGAAGESTGGSQSGGGSSSGGTGSGIGGGSAGGSDSGGDSAIGGTAGADSMGGTIGEAGSTTGGSSAGSDPGAESCFSAVVTSNAHSCALRNDGTLFCWGRNQFGELGLGTTGVAHPEPAQVPDISGVTRVASKSSSFSVDTDPSGVGHTCAIDGDGDVICWGRNRWGQVGNGAWGVDAAPSVVLSGAEEISTGGVHSCALAGDQVYCWGVSPMAGVASTMCDSGVPANCVPSPTPIAGIPGGALALLSGEQSSCADFGDGTPQCWGASAALAYDAGIGPFTSPVPANQFDGEVAEMDSGIAFSCARKTDGSLWCVGVSYFGGLGLGSVNEAPTAQRITALGDDVTEVGVGTQVMCAAKADGSLWCTGRNDYGQVGPDNAERCNEPPVVCVRTPQEVPELTDVAQVSPGLTHTCAVLENGSVWCWGRNHQGQLGDGSYQDSPTPVQVDLPCP